jgi:hypothetical protein
MRCAFLAAIAALGATASAGTIFLPGYPDRILVIDEATQKVVDKIQLDIGIPTGMIKSFDRRKIYVTSNDNSGVAVIDMATHKVLQSFVLNSGAKRVRINGVAPDPRDQVLYTVYREVTKLSDRYELGKWKYGVIDLAQQKIVRTADMASEDQEANGAFYGRSPFHVSPDGRFIYQFRDKVTILDSGDFHVVDRINLSQPDFPDLTAVGMGATLQTLEESGAVVSMFNAEDDAVHRRMFGIARFDLNSREFSFQEVGPAPDGLVGLEVSPDRKTGYSVVMNGERGNRRCEFWAFDLAANRRTATSEFPCRPRFSFGMSSDGKHLYLYGAGFEVEVWDATTFKLERVMDLQNDVTMGGLVVVP